MYDKQRIESLVKEFLLVIGENIEREGLVDTPKRVAEMIEEMLCSGKYSSEYTSFDSNDYDGIITIKDIDFSSICEHHLLPFYGKINIAYIPNEKILGISKFARIIDDCTKKLQLQEKLAQEILTNIRNSINPKGIAIHIEANHICMNIRGVKRRCSTTTTFNFYGNFKDLKYQQLFIDTIKS